MAEICRVTIRIDRLRTHLFKADRVGRTDEAIRSWLKVRGIWPEGDHWLAQVAGLDAVPAEAIVEQAPLLAAPWRGDRLYDVLLQEADAQWESLCRAGFAGGERWGFVMVEEYVAEDGGGMCAGPVLRAWRRDDRGLREIDEGERVAHRNAWGNCTFPFVWGQFRIRPDRHGVALGWMHMARAGSGGVYAVRWNGGVPLLVEQEGDWWIS